MQPYFYKADIGFSSDIDPSMTWKVNNLGGFAALDTDPSHWPLQYEDTTLADKTIRALVAT